MDKTTGKASRSKHCCAHASLYFVETSAKGVCEINQHQDWHLLFPRTQDHTSCSKINQALATNKCLQSDASASAEGSGFLDLSSSVGNSLSHISDGSLGNFTSQPATTHSLDLRSGRDLLEGFLAIQKSSKQALESYNAEVVLLLFGGNQSLLG